MSMIVLMLWKMVLLVKLRWKMVLWMGMKFCFDGKKEDGVIKKDYVSHRK